MRLNWPEGIGSGFGRKRIPKLRGIGESAIAHGGRASSSGSGAFWVSVEQRVRRSLMHQIFRGNKKPADFRKPAGLCVKLDARSDAKSELAFKG